MQINARQDFVFAIADPQTPKVDRRLAQVRALLFGDQAGLDGASDNALVVEPTTIVTDFDDNVATLVVSTQSQLAGARLAVRYGRPRLTCRGDSPMDC